MPAHVHAMRMLPARTHTPPRSVDTLGDKSGGVGGMVAMPGSLYTAVMIIPVLMSGLTSGARFFLKCLWDRWGRGALLRLPVGEGKGGGAHCDTRGGPALA